MLLAQQLPVTWKKPEIKMNTLFRPQFPFPQFSQRALSSFVWAGEASRAESSELRALLPSPLFQRLVSMPAQLAI